MIVFLPTIILIIIIIIVKIIVNIIVNSINIGLIPEGEQKAHKYICFACSALCTGNYDLYVLVLHLSSSLLKNRRMTKKSRPLTPELSPSKSPGLKMIHAGPDLDGLIILRRPRFHLRGVQLVIY